MPLRRAHVAYEWRSRSGCTARPMQAVSAKHLIVFWTLRGASGSHSPVLGLRLAVTKMRSPVPVVRRRSAYFLSRTNNSGFSGTSRSRAPLPLTLMQRSRPCSTRSPRRRPSSPPNLIPVSADSHDQFVAVCARGVLHLLDLLACQRLKQLVLVHRLVSLDLAANRVVGLAPTDERSERSDVSATDSRASGLPAGVRCDSSR